MSFAQRLDQARGAKGLTSNALSKRLGISSTAVWNWDHGNTKPKPETLERVAQELGVSADWLRDGEPDSDKESPREASKVAQLTVSDVLADAKIKISAILGMPESRVRLELNLS